MTNRWLSGPITKWVFESNIFPGSIWTTVVQVGSSAAPGDGNYDPPIPQSDVTDLVDDLAARQLTSEKDQPGGYAGLNGSGKLATSTIPALALVEVFTPADQAAMLALTAQPGDVAIRYDISATFMLAGNPAVLADWIPLPSPTDVVLSVNGQIGLVNLGAADVGAVPTTRTIAGLPLTGDLTATQVRTALGLGTAAQAAATDFATAAQGMKADSAVQPDALAEVATSGDYNDLDNLPDVPAAVEAGILAYFTANPNNSFIPVSDLDSLAIIAGRPAGDVAIVSEDSDHEALTTLYISDGTGWDFWLAFEGGGGATPGGSDTEVQFNDNGTGLGGSPNFTFDPNTNDLTLVGAFGVTGDLIIEAGALEMWLADFTRRILRVASDGSAVFLGGDDDGHARLVQASDGTIDLLVQDSGGGERRGLRVAADGSVGIVRADGSVDYGSPGQFLTPDAGLGLDWATPSSGGSATLPLVHLLAAGADLTGMGATSYTPGVSITWPGPQFLDTLIGVWDTTLTGNARLTVFEADGVSNTMLPAAIQPTVVAESMPNGGAIVPVLVVVQDILPGFVLTPELYQLSRADASSEWSITLLTDGGVELGETSSTAYRGDRGKTAYDHSQASGNPHGTTAAQVGAAQIVNTDGDSGTTIYVGSIDPDVDYSPVDGDLWFPPEV